MSKIEDIIAETLEPALIGEWRGASTEEYLSTIDTNKKVIYAVSDIHTEFYESAEEVFDSIQWRTATHLVLAGDVGVVCTKLEIYKNFLVLCKKKYKNVVLIPGNHEYYSCEGDRKAVENILRSTCEVTGVHYIHEKNVVIDGVRFIGHTLWSLIEKEACDQIADFPNRVFDSQYDYVASFIDGYRFIEKEIFNSLDSDEPTIVVTHHLPSRRLIHPKFKNNSMNSAFASDVTGTMHMGRVKYWFCGHTHEYAETKFMDTKIIANPIGYPGETRVTRVSLTTYEL